MDAQQGIRNFGAYSEFRGTISDFEVAYKFGLRGFSDLDLVYEKHGKILLIEGKQITEGKIKVNVGQFLLLKAFWEKEDIEVYIVGQQKITEGKYSFYPIEFELFAQNSKDELNHRSQAEKTIAISIIERYSEVRFWTEFIRPICEGFE